MSNSENSNYTLENVAASLNYGKPLTISARRVTRVMLWMLFACVIVSVVAGLTGFFLGDFNISVLLIFIALSVFILVLIAVIRRALSQCDKRERNIIACFDDAVETQAIIRYESHIYNDGSNGLVYVAYFTYDGVDYAVAPNKIPNRMTEGDRKDLSVFTDKKCNILYSFKYNDVIILKSTSCEEVM